MKITKSQLKQMIQEELKDVQEQQSIEPSTPEEYRDELATSSRKRRAIGKSVRGHFQCDTRVHLHMREECHEAVDRGETFWPAMPPGERSQPRDFNPSPRPRMSYERPPMPSGVRGDGIATHGASGTFRENKMKLTKSQLKQIIQEEYASMLEDEEVRNEFDPGEYDLEPEAEEYGARDPEQDQETMQDIEDMYNELIVDLEDVEDPRMKAKLIKLFQGALESEGEVFNLEP